MRLTAEQVPILLSPYAGAVHFLEDNLSLDEIYDAICKRLQERYAEQGEKISDEEVRKATDNLLRYCNRIIDINDDKNIK